MFPAKNGVVIFDPLMKLKLYKSVCTEPTEITYFSSLYRFGHFSKMDKRIQDAHKSFEGDRRHHRHGINIAHKPNFFNSVNSHT